MAVANRFVDGLVRRLTPLGPVVARAMFGGWGVYLDGACFAIVAGTTVFFKVDDANRADFERRGMGPFQPWEDRPTVLKSFYEVPAELVQDGTALRRWAEGAVRAARAAARAKSKRQKR